MYMRMYLNDNSHAYGPNLTRVLVMYPFMPSVPISLIIPNPMIVQFNAVSLSKLDGWPDKTEYRATLRNGLFN